MPESRVALSLCSLLVLGACGTTPPTVTPEVETGPPMSAAEREAELGELARTLALAARDGLSPEECTTLEDGYARLAERSPNQPEPRFGLAVVLEACGENDRAEKVYATLPSFSPALVNLGALAWARGDLDLAITKFERAVAVDPLAVTAGNDLSAALAERHRRTRSRRDFEGAERAAQRVLAIDSENQLAYENLARLYYERGRVEEPSFRLLAGLVVSQGQQVLARQGQASAELENLLGLLALLDEDPARAIRAFQRAVVITPDHVDAHRNLALVAIRFRDFALAKRSLDRVLASPAAATDVEAWLALGVVQRGLRDFDAAERAYQRAGEISPDDPRPAFNLGVLAQDHKVAFAEDSADWIALSNEAVGHFEAFVAKAGAAPSWQPSVATAKDRIVVARDTVDALERAAILQAEIDARMDAEALIREREKQRRLQLEREAVPVTHVDGEDPSKA